MQVRIHRGCHEIGGACVELAYAGETLLIDLGLPLGETPRASLLPGALPELVGGPRPGFHGVLVSHAHLDHYGLAAMAHPELPYWMGRDTEALLAAAACFGPMGARFRNVGHFRHGEPFRVGPFTVTPHLVDHSAYDAYAFVVEAGGRSLFYSGDLRAHGRKAETFERLLREVPQGVDALLLEGTTVGRPVRGPAVRESALELALTDAFASTPGLALACFSAQNIDRLVTVYKASRAGGRTLVMDAYQAHLVGALARPSLPSAGWGRDRVRVFVPTRQRRHLRATGRTELLAPFARAMIGPAELARTPSRFTLTFRAGARRDLERAGCLPGARLVYSLWPGYLERPGDDTRAWCAAHDVSLVAHHTSGHADVADLQRLCAALAPRRVVPIHTDAAHRYAAYFPAVEAAVDGEWLVL